MLTPEFAELLDQAAPQQRVTGILSWRNAIFFTSGGEELWSQIQRLKQPLLDRLDSVAGVRVNPLPGLPQAMVEASAATWQDLLRDNAILREGEEVELVVNQPGFHTQVPA